MAGTGDKENIANGLMIRSSLPEPSGLSPKKTSRKTRSKSIGPGGLGELDLSALKQASGNRRKSAFIPAVKSILASNDEDEKKRREARRKSLARRRVSFAPEATLHTWDVVEYLRDATSSSASSEATRRASNVSQASASSAPESDPAEPPSTPPEQVEEPEQEPESSPASQREQHQKKNRRRSSGIPPMNFNNPDDVYSSSPLSGDNVSPDDTNEADSDSDDDEITGNFDQSGDIDDSSQSSAKLDAALRQASALAATQQLDFDNDGDMTMDIANDEITASFKPWSHKNATPQDNQENVDPASPDSGGADDEDMSMDITRAVGRIVPQQHEETQSSDMEDDMSMELTMPLGSIQAMASNAPANRRKSLKRRVSMLEASQGSPAKRPASRRTSLRPRRRSEEHISEDATMDLTMAIGAIKKQTPSEAMRRASIETSVDDATMDFTLAVGSIKNDTSNTVNVHENDQEEGDQVDEDLSMEFTKIVGPGIKRLEKTTATPEKPGPDSEAPTATKTPTPHKSPKISASELKANNKLEDDPVLEAIAHTEPHHYPPVTYPVLDPGTPEIVRQKDFEQVEPSPFVRRTPQSAARIEKFSTPSSQASKPSQMVIPEDPIAAPILNRRRSSLSAVQFSPLNASREEPTLKSTALLSNNIKLLSTPRKQTLVSPVKRGMTPKKSQTPQKLPTPKQKTPTPKKATPRKSVSPKKRVVFGEQPEEETDLEASVTEDVSEVERISLQDFLDMTKIRFMDLSTTKRRHTAAPAAFHDVEVEEKEESLDRYVVAGACIAPEYELYQHACHEMKKYISDGRIFVRTVEANVMEENPLLFSEYLTAPPDQRVVMDNQFKNLKTNARLSARGEWYTWRSTLLQNLKGGLLETLNGFKRDETKITSQEQLLDAVLPALVERQESLSKECQQLQQRHDELNSCDREELEQTREKLIATDAQLEEKKQLLVKLQEELADKEAHIEAAKARKIECMEEIKTAERIREECRGWSTTEVSELKAKVYALEQAHDWSITSASSTSITMTHKNDLELYFQPSAFATGGNTANASIALAYIGDSATPHPRPLTTSKRFFLQLIRAQLHCIPQSQTRISSLLSLVKHAWTTALAVAEGVRWLEHNYITEEFILSDERMGISANMLLPTVQTKVKTTFEIGVGFGKESVETEVDIKAEVVYGEKYGEEKMSAFLRDFCGNEIRDKDGMAVWADAMVDLGARLRKTGRKGERK